MLLDAPETQLAGKLIAVVGHRSAVKENGGVSMLYVIIAEAYPRSAEQLRKYSLKAGFNIMYVGAEQFRQDKSHPNCVRLIAV